MPDADAALRVVLEQRQEVLEAARLALAERERAVLRGLDAAARADARLDAAAGQLGEASHAPTLDVVLLGQIELFLQQCERDVLARREELGALREAAEAARAAVATAHQGVRALELVLESRAKQRLERVRRIEARESDEIGARVVSRRRPRPGILV